MRGVFVAVRAIAATHVDVIGITRGAPRYYRSMRGMLKILCSLLLVAILLGSAQSDGSSNREIATALPSAPLLLEASCTEASGIGICHFAFAGKSQPPTPQFRANLTRFIVPPLGTASQRLAPTPPPPRKAA